MSEAFIVRRGGSGGLSAGGAVLHITAPAGSTITLKKGDVTVATLAAARGHTNASDTTLADWYYAIVSTNYGSWTATAARDGETASRTVTVDSAKQYDVFLAYNIYLIRDGVLDSNVNATFGATSGAKSGNNYVITSEGSGSDNYCWLSISSSLGDIESCPTLAADISGMTADLDVAFALVDTDDGWYQGSDHVMAYTSIAASSSFPATINLDVSSLTVTNQYVRFTIPYNYGHGISVRNLYFKRGAV